MSTENKDMFRTPFNAVKQEMYTTKRGHYTDIVIDGTIILKMDHREIVCENVIWNGLLRILSNDGFS
jgi:hypothetical protein